MRSQPKVHIAIDGCALTECGTVSSRLILATEIEQHPHACLRCRSAHRRNTQHAKRIVLVARRNSDAWHVVRYFGAECQANPESTLEDYKLDIALRLGFDSWAAMPIETKSKALREFIAGKREEAAQK